jgi:hypothetical protein
MQEFGGGAIYLLLTKDRIVFSLMILASETSQLNKYAVLG